MSTTKWGKKICSSATTVNTKLSLSVWGNLNCHKKMVHDEIKSYKITFNSPPRGIRIPNMSSFSRPTPTSKSTRASPTPNSGWARSGCSCIGWQCWKQNICLSHCVVGCQMCGQVTGDLSILYFTGYTFISKISPSVYRWSLKWLPLLYKVLWIHKICRNSLI